MTGRLCFNCAIPSVKDWMNPVAEVPRGAELKRIADTESIARANATAVIM